MRYTRFIPDSEKTTAGGRARKPEPITEKQWTRIVKAIRLGCNLTDAAMYAKISPLRLERHMNADAHMEERILRLFIICKVHHLQKIHAGEKGWQASAWFLERVYRKEYCLHLDNSKDEEKAIQIRKIIRKAGKMPMKQVEAN